MAQQQQQQHHHHDQHIRFAAQSLYDNIGVMQYPQYYRGPVYQPSMDMNRTHSINLITEEYLSGYMQDGRMSIVRRFFCLFVTFDLVFISLLWLICILITGDDIYDALKFQILHYSIYTSVFDIVMAAICRFVVLILFYALLYINHWLIIALSTTGSCMFLISKVFFYDWLAPKQPVFEVVLIIVSFVLAWGEAWFLDCRVIPQERHARHHFTAVTTSDRSPLLAPFLSADTDIGVQQPESVANFYSPYDTTHNSDDEDEQDEEYRKMGNECVRKAYELLQSSDWKAEKVTKKGDTIQSKQNEKLGKIYRLTARVKYPAKSLLEELFYKVEEIPKWNPTLLESKVIRKIDTHTDISYQATTGGGGGLVKSRDFVNLRCWRQCRDGKIIIESDNEEDDENDPNDSYQPSTAEGSVSTISDNEYLQDSRDSFVKKSASEAAGIDEKLITPNGAGGGGNNVRSAFKTLSKSLGARDFQMQIETPPPLDDEFSDAHDNLIDDTSKLINQQKQQQQQIKNDVGGNPELTSEKFTDKIYISAALSIEYGAVPNNTKYIRGENLVSCWAMREIEGKPDVCIFEWLLCLDLKGYIPRYVLDQAYTSLMQDYMTYLRKYCKELRQKRKKVPKINY